MKSEPSFLHSAFRNAWLILLLAVIGGGLGAAYASAQEDEYRAFVTMVVTAAPDLPEGELTDVARSLESGSIQRTFALVLDSSRTEEAAAAQLPDVAFGDYAITAFALAQSNAVRVEVDGADPGTAREIANAVAAVGAKEFERLYQGFAAEKITAPGEEPSSVSSSPAVFGVLGAAAGAFFGFLLGLLLDAWRSRPRPTRRRSSSAPATEPAAASAATTAVPDDLVSSRAAVESTIAGDLDRNPS